jgi:hypothetical protein
MIPSRCEAFQFDWDLGQQINPFPQPGLRTKEPRHAGALLFFYTPVNRFNFRLWRCFTSEFGDVESPIWAKMSNPPPAFKLKIKSQKSAVNPILQRFCKYENSSYFCYRNLRYGNLHCDKS